MVNIKKKQELQLFCCSFAPTIDIPYMSTYLNYVFQNTKCNYSKGF